jgi:hypothetical protein
VLQFSAPKYSALTSEVINAGIAVCRRFWYDFVRRRAPYCSSATIFRGIDSVGNPQLTQKILPN